MPKQGLQMTEGMVSKWLVPEGGECRKDEPLFEIETDKTAITIGAPENGTLLKIVALEGETVPVAEIIAYIGKLGENADALEDGTETKIPEPHADAIKQSYSYDIGTLATETGSKFLTTPRARLRAMENNIYISSIKGSGPEGAVIERDVNEKAGARKASPLAKKRAELNGVSIDEILGSGLGGKVMTSDVKDMEGDIKETLIPLTSMRRIIAERMHSSLHEMAQACHRISVDMTAAAALRKYYQETAGKRISYNDIVLYFTAKALAAHPYLNASFTEKGILLKKYFNIGIAVAVENGLMVPVIRDLDRMDIIEISEEATDLSARAKAIKLLPNEISGGTFTVTNLGMFGIKSFTAIINPPEAGILAVGEIQKTPVIVSDGIADAIAIRPIAEICLTYDHRVVDGAGAAKFLCDFKSWIENPDMLMKNGKA